VEYRARRTLFDRESVFSIESGSLVRAVNQNVAQRIALADVHRVTLAYSPLTVIERWTCSIEGHGGRIWIPSASFTGPGTAEDRRGTFRPFVETLTRACSDQPSAGSIGFVTGGAWSSYGALALLVFLGIAAALLALGAIGTLLSGAPVSGAVWTGGPAVITIVCARIVWRMWRRNRPGAFDPKSLPADFASVSGT